MFIAVSDVTAILQLRVRVDGSKFDRSVMTQPEFVLFTHVIFRSVQHGGTQLQASWRVLRSFHEFMGLDAQLRQLFPQGMKLLAPPPQHRRRMWLRRHRSVVFLAKRCAELNEYLGRLLSNPHLRLTRFLDPRAPLVLRYFCNFDAGLTTAEVTVLPNQFESYVLCLDYRDRDKDLKGRMNETLNSSEYSALEGVEFDDELDERGSRDQLIEQRKSSRRTDGRSDNARLDELQANLMDDKARNLAVCIKYECACRTSSFGVTYNNMVEMLRLRGLKQTYVPPVGAPTALYCILYKLQQFNDLDKRLYDALTGFSPNTSNEIGVSTLEVSDALANDHLQLSVGVGFMRQTLANYGLLHVHTLERHFRTAAVDLKKRLHEFKSRYQFRVGALELVLLATMLDLCIQLIANDHEGSELRILPLAGLRSIRKGGRITITCGYILPTLVCVDGFYLLAEQDQVVVRSITVIESEETVLTEQQRSRMWQGVDEMDRCFMAEIERTISSGVDAFALAFDFDVADSLNSAILDAVWDDCQHNPNLFYLFHRQARQFGKGRTTARFFLQYLEVAFGLEGASYLVDFLLHVLPEEELRKQLLRARWMRLHRQLAKRVLP